MNTIWKYQLNLGASLQSVDMPMVARILTAQIQGQFLNIWAEVCTTNANETRAFEIFATGQEIPNDPNTERTYISTIQAGGGALVFHIYERRNFPTRN